MATNLSRTPSGAGNQRTWTYSGWFKICTIDLNVFLLCAGAYGDSKSMQLEITNTGPLQITGYSSGGSADFHCKTNAELRDTSAWYHIVVAMDTTQSTSTDRLKIYINGELQTLSTATYPSQNYDTGVNTTIAHEINDRPSASFEQTLYATHLHLTDGTAYAASYFGESDSTSGIWKPKTAPSVTYGTNGFFLKFENSGAMGTDSSGQSNTFTVGGTLTQNVDTPSNNFCTINPLNIVATGLTLSNGNLSITGNTGGAWRSLGSSFGVSSGKYYYECKIKSFNTGLHLGIIDYTQLPQTNAYAYQYSRAYMYKDDGNKANNNSSTSYGNSFTTNDIIGVALDLDNGKIYFSKNGTYQNSGDPTTGSTGTGSAFDITSGYDYTPVFSTNNTADQIEYNFGGGYFGTTAVASAGTAPSEGGIFEYNCPNGYQALCTKGINSF